MASFGFGVSKSLTKHTHLGVGSAPIVTKRKDAPECTTDEPILPPSDVRPHVFLDIEIDGSFVGRILCELYSDVVPLTALNFLHLCRGDKGRGISGESLHYKNSKFHHIVPSQFIVGGDITKGNGTGGESVYGPRFDDENFNIGHSRPGLLSMANFGPNTNGSQFFLTTRENASLNGRHVIFGHVDDGMDVVHRIELYGQSHMAAKGVTTMPRTDMVQSFSSGGVVKISDCGELPKVKLLQLGEENQSETKRRRQRTEEEIGLFHILKKHCDSASPVSWQCKPVTCKKAKAKLALETLRKRIVGSISVQSAFSQLAREHSDSASAQAGGDLGMVTRENLEVPLQDIAFSLAKMGLSEVFETSEGFNLLLRAC